jgi:hypothetical protein
LASRTVLSGCGTARLSRRRYEVPAGGSQALVDDLIDAAQQSVSLAVREMCCRIGSDSASFKRAAQNLDRIGQLRLSDESLRRVAESEGRAVLAWQDHEQLELDFDAGRCLTDQTQDHTPTTRVYVGIDGFMLPMVSDAEMGKRFEKAKARRRQLPRRRGVRRRPLVRRQGADQRYKEFKLVTMYDQDQRHKLVRITRGGPEPARKMLRQMADDVHLCRAQQVVAVTDGAEWIAGLIERNLPKAKTTAVLDFYHAAEHVHQARRSLFGEEDAAGQTWADQLIHGMLNDPWESWWETLVSTRGRTRSPAKRHAVDALMQYLLTRRQKIDYARFRSMGLKIGSGVTESSCKSESRRLKGVGMRWTAANAEAMTALEALHQSNLWSTYWQFRTKAAA